MSEECKHDYLLEAHPIWQLVRIRCTFCGDVRYINEESIKTLKRIIGEKKVNTEEKYMIKPIEIELDVPYYMPMKVYNEFRKRVKQEKKFIVMATSGVHARGEGIVLNIKLVMEW